MKILKIAGIFIGLWIAYALPFVIVFGWFSGWEVEGKFFFTVFGTMGILAATGISAEHL